MRQYLSVTIAIGGVLLASDVPAQRNEVAPTWTLVEDLRITGDAGPKSFNDVRTVVAPKNGNIFVLDFKTREIRLFDSKGNFLKLVSRNGAGPGEIRNANGMAIGKGDTIWVNDPSNSRFSLFTPDGQFIKQVLIPIRSYGYLWEAAIDDKGRAIDLPISVPTGKTNDEGRPITEPRLRLVTSDGKADTIPFPMCTPGTPPKLLAFTQRGGGGNMVRGLPFLPRQQVVLTRSGVAWCSAMAEYRLLAGAVGGPLKEVVKLDVAPLPVTAEERKKELDAIDSTVKAYGPLTQGDPSLIPKNKPVIARLFADDQSRAWVRLTDTPEATPSFDVFDTAGKMVARVRSQGKFGYQAFIAGGHVYTVITDDDDVPAIVRYRIVR